VTWLARGRHVETAYLSLTRGDGGQNLIGNELYEGLGAIRTEELLAARRIDGAKQYFTRAFDFGFSKTIEDTYRFWPKDTILGDVVRVVRAFRPHVIVPVFSGTERDGHGHHQVSGLLAREVFDAAADTVRYPSKGFGAPWATPKLYHQRTYFNHEGATYKYDAGEYDPVLGMSYAEIAARSRSQHKSQAFGQLEPKGSIVGSLARERTRVNESTPAAQEQGIFDGIDTTFARLKPAMKCDAARAALDTLARDIAAAQRELDVTRPARIVPRLASAQRQVRNITGVFATRTPGSRACPTEDPEVLASLDVTRRRIDALLPMAAGVSIEVTAPRERWPLEDSIPVRITVYNRGRDSVSLLSAPGSISQLVLPDSSVSYRTTRPAPRRGEPWWLRHPRGAGMFNIAPEDLWRLTEPAEENARFLETRVDIAVGSRANTAVIANAIPVTWRYADPIRGEVNRPVVAAPAISVTLDDATEYVPARQAVDRTVRVRLRSADTARREVIVRLALPSGLTTDSATRTVTLAGYDARATASFRLRGELPAGRHRMSATAESNGQRYADGYVEIAYDHIRPQRLYRPATMELVAVDVNVPRGLRVAYVPGVGDNVAPTLAQLGLDVTVLSPDSVAVADLSRFRTVVLGPRVYEANPALAAANGRLFDWARTGGTLVVQYQQDIARRGLAPLPLTLAQRAERVTEEDAPVKLLDPSHALLSSPNRITAQDFAGWVQERSTYMPSTFDAGYTPLVEMADTGMQPNRGGILVAPLGSGTYVLATLAFFRQLPAGNPGAARLFVNLLSATSDAKAAVAP
jgi:LmbE family N-acetylglucosaminyl deacetylase